MDDQRADALAAIAVELAAERFGPARLRRPKVHDAETVIKERRRILLGADGVREADARIRDGQLAETIRKWTT